MRRPAAARSTEVNLPKRVREKALVTTGGEHARRMGDVVEAIEAGRAAGLACLGGQVQWKYQEVTCEAYWLDFDPDERGESESWPEYVERSSDEAIGKFRKLCEATDFRQRALEWEAIRAWVHQHGSDPDEYLWFPVYFSSDVSE
jgi:hypothetical protein